MTQIDKILAEIQRLKKELKDYSATEALDYIESYVNLIAREQPQEPTIKGWVARDKGAKSCCFYFNKPARNTLSWMDYDDDYVFLSDLHLDVEDLKWEDEPVEVELIIRQL